MNVQQKKSRAAQVEAYWKKVDGNTESHVKKVAKKFGLKFATLIYDSAPDSAESVKVVSDNGELAALAGVDTPEGMATFIFYV